MRCWRLNSPAAFMRSRSMRLGPGRRMARHEVRAVRGVDLVVTNLARALEFYAEVWNLAPVEVPGNVAYLRGTGPYHHIVSLREGPRTALVRIVLEAADRGAVDGVYQQVLGSRQPVSG